MIPTPRHSSQKILGQTSGSVRYEIQNPIGMLRSYAEMVRFAVGLLVWNGCGYGVFCPTAGQPRRQGTRSASTQNKQLTTCVLGRKSVAYR